MSLRALTAAVLGAGALILASGAGIALAQANEGTPTPGPTLVEPEATTTTTGLPEQESTTTTTTTQLETDADAPVEAGDDDPGERSGEPGNRWFRDCLAEHGVAWPPGVGYHKPERKGPPSEELRQQIRAAKEACSRGR